MAKKKKTVKPKKAKKVAKPHLPNEVKVDTSKAFNQILFDLDLELNRADQLTINSRTKIQQINNVPTHDFEMRETGGEDVVSRLNSCINRLKMINDSNEGNLNLLINLI